MPPAPPQNIADLIKKKLEIPTPPKVLSQVMQELRDKAASADRLAKIISGDQGLTARLLRIANSPFYGLPREVKNIQRAVVILGFKTIQGLVVSASSRMLYKRFGPVEQALWEHSLAAAIAAHLIAITHRMPCREDAFVAGLMHDIGKVIMNNEAPDPFGASLKMAVDEEIESFEAEQQIYTFNHMDVGSLLVKQWQLSEDLENVVFLHHDLDLAGTVAADSMQLICVANLANKICHSLGIGTGRPPREINFDEEPAVGELALDPESLTELMEQVKAGYEKEKGLFMA